MPKKQFNKSKETEPEGTDLFGFVSFSWFKTLQIV